MVFVVVGESSDAGLRLGETGDSGGQLAGPLGEQLVVGLVEVLVLRIEQSRVSVVRKAANHGIGHDGAGVPAPRMTSFFMGCLSSPVSWNAMIRRPFLAVGGTRSGFSAIAV